jgi:hypothetical protein
MFGMRCLVWIALGSLAACAFDVTGQGMDEADALGGSGESDGEGESAGAQTSSTSGGGTSASSGGSTSSSATQSGSDTTDPTGATGSTTQGGTETGVDTDGVLQIAESPAHDFGAVALSAAAGHVFTVSNAGDVDAADVVGVVAAPFAFAGGAFPGTGGDCGSVIVAGSSCTVAVDFVPVAFGAAAGVLAIQYTDQGAPEVAAVDVTGSGIGTTSNLLANPGAETPGDPPPGWNAAGGPWRTTTEFARTGTHSLFCGETNVDALFILEQIVDVGAHAAIIDGEGLRADFEAWARSWDVGNEPYRIWIRFLDASAGDLGTSLTDWNSGTTFAHQSLSAVTPAGTRAIAVRLHAEKDGGTLCDVFFDDVALTLSYPAP